MVASGDVVVGGICVTLAIKINKIAQKLGLLGRNYFHFWRCKVLSFMQVWTCFLLIMHSKQANESW